MLQTGSGSSKRPVPDASAYPQGVLPERWAISFDQLMEIHDRAKAAFGPEFSTMTMRDLNDRLIKPKCAETGTSYAMALNPSGLLLDTFVTHAWDEPFAEFVQSIREAFAHHAEKPNLWICSFALVQSDDARVIESQLGNELDHAPFIQALRHASCFLVVRNRNTDLYDRAWCICELVEAIDLGLCPKKTIVTGPNAFSGKQSSCLHAKCRKMSDHVKILHHLIGNNDTARIEKVDGQISMFRKFESSKAQQEMSKKRPATEGARPRSRI